MTRSGKSRRMGESGLVQAVDTSGALIQAIDDFNFANIKNYAKLSLAPRDFVKSFTTPNGQLLIAMSASPLDEGKQSTILFDKTALPIPLEYQFEANISQRINGAFGQVEIIGINEADSASSNRNIATIQQATTTLTITFATAWPELEIGDIVAISGLVDNRLNYAELTVASKTSNNLTITATVANNIALPSLTVGPYSSQGVATLIPQIANTSSGIAHKFNGNSATALAYLTKVDSIQNNKSGTLVGVQTAASGSSVPVWTSAANGQYDLRSTTRFYTTVSPYEVSFYDVAVDGFSFYTNRLKRTTNKPAWQKQYFLRLRMNIPKSATCVAARIVSATKLSASTTATIVTREPHGLVTGNYVTIHGINNQTNFANLVTPTAITYVNDTTFTIPIGTAAIATSYGGIVMKVNGGVLMPGLIAQSIQSVARDANNLITVVGTAAWAGLQIGEYYNIHGTSSSANGSDLGFDGVYELISFSGTSAVFTPLFADFYGDLEGQTLAATGLFGTTGCGGAVILRTTMRIHDLVVGKMPNHAQRVQAEGIGTIDQAKGAPVNVAYMPPVGISGNVNMLEAGMLAPSTFSLSSAASTNSTNVKATAGVVTAFLLTNYGASDAYFKLYNKATAPVVGTDVPVANLKIPANGDRIIDGARLGVRFPLGIGLAITGAQAVSDTTAVAANQVTVFGSWV